MNVNSTIRLDFQFSKKNVLTEIEVISYLNGLDWQKLYNYYKEAFNLRLKTIQQELKYF